MKARTSYKGRHIERTRTRGDSPDSCICSLAVCVKVEHLVEAGFAPLEAIKIASFNGARFLGEDAHIGSIAVGSKPT
ncbi:MAG TPA: amidohydrolase family protein [Blastocatellia bacterium]|nr:amidohydrolase family protein [Blastocatellia bacterium]